MEYKSFAFTVRPKNGMTDELQRKLLVWLKKQDYGFAVTEMESEARHIHGQLFTKTPRTKGAVQLSLERIQEKVDPDWDPASKKVLRRGVKIAYNHQFVEEYLNKEDSTIIYNSPPEEEAEYYPSEEEQQKVKDASNAVDKRLHSIAILYKTFTEENPKIKLIKLREQRISIFLYNSWYINKTLPTLPNIKHEKELLRRVRNYIYPYYDGYKELIPERLKTYLDTSLNIYNADKV